MDEICYREMTVGDRATALALRNTVFAHSPLTMADWDRDAMLASVAARGDEIVGAIPLVLRELVLAPGLTIRAPFENAVGTREDLRSRGIGSGMIAAARTFMRDRADGLFVYRGAERSAGYRFYRKSGHYDLLYTHSYRLDRPQQRDVPADVTPVTAATIGGHAEQLLPLFASSYGALAGYPRRHAGYWTTALASSIFAAIPMDLSLLRIGDTQESRGYALLGMHTRRADGLLHILELATQGADLAVAAEVLAAAGGVAAVRDLHVAIKLAPDDPFVPAVLAAGYAADGRGTMVLGQILDIPDFFARYRAAAFRLDGVGLRVWTPEQDHVLLPPRQGFPTLTLEMKEATLHRWLLGRIDLAARLREGTVTVNGTGPAAIRAVCTAIPYTPWAYQQLDWI